MAINKKGSRKIVVDDVAYLWRVRRKTNYWQMIHGSPATAGVSLLSGDGQLLHIIFPFLRMDGANYNNTLPKHSEPITPKIIADCIQKAQAQGWQTHGKGVFQYEYKTDSEIL